MRRQLLFVGALAALLVPAAALAFGAATGDTVTVPAGTTKSGTYFAAGAQVNVAGTIDGDLVCAGSSVTVTGTVRGDVLCAGQLVQITGTVEGSVRAAGQTVTLDGTVGRNLLVAGQSIETRSSFRANGDAGLFGQTVRLAGSIARDVYGAMQYLTLNGETGSVLVNTDTVSLGDSGQVNGAVQYTAPQASTFDHSRVSGDVKFTQLHRQDPVRAAQSAWVGGLLYFLAAEILAAVVLIALAPQWLRRTSHLMTSSPWASVGWGLLVLFAAPAALLTLGLTLIGLPLAFLLGGALAAMLLVSPIFAGVAAALWAWKRSGNPVTSLWLAAITGLFALTVLYAVPVIGQLVWLISSSWVIGALAIQLVQARREQTS